MESRLRIARVIAMVGTGLAVFVGWDASLGSDAEQNARVILYAMCGWLAGSAYVSGKLL